MGPGAGRGRPAKKKPRRSTSETTASPQRSGADASNERTPETLAAKRIKLKGNEGTVISGFARISVEKGEAWVAGRRLNAGSGAIQVRTGRGMENGVGIEAVGGAVVTKVPCAPSSECAELLLEPLVAAVVDAEQDEPAFVIEGTQNLEAFQAGAGAAGPCIFPEPWRMAANQVVGMEAAAGKRRSVGARPVPVAAVVGPKGAGKSTFSRLLVNSLLNHFPAVAFVDTDAGQPEFSPPGLLSVSIIHANELLAGLPHDHQRCTWEHALFTGAISPSADPDAYLAAVQDLLAWVSGPDGPRGRMPVVLNTHGWIKGLGLDILATILQLAEPSHVVQLDQGAPSAAIDFPPGNWWTADPSTGAATPQPAAHILVPSAKAFLSPEAAKGGGSAVAARVLRWIAWARLSCCQDPDRLAQLRSPSSTGEAEVAADLLAETPPYVVPAVSMPLRFLHSQPPAGEELRAANGALVGLMSTQSEGASRCLGIGLIRGIDCKAPGDANLHILTATPQELLPAVTELAVGSLEIPPQLLHSSRFASPYISLFCLAAEGTGAGKMQSRNTLIRRAAA